MKITKKKGAARAAALIGSAAVAALGGLAANAADVPANIKPALGTTPDAAMLPKAEFVFPWNEPPSPEERRPGGVARHSHGIRPRRSTGCVHRRGGHLAVSAATAERIAGA